MGIKQQAGKAGRLATSVVLPRLPGKITSAAPGATHTFVREALSRAIKGVGPLPGAAAAAEEALAVNQGNVDKAIRDIITKHVRYAAAQGFVTNLGGLLTMVVTVPANISGLALVEARMVAAIAHLRGYDIEDPRVRNAVLMTLLGKDKAHELVASKKLPAPPMALATAPAHDPNIDKLIASEVALELVSRVTQKRLLSTAGRKVPVFGGAVGGSADALATWQLGRYASRELRPRTRR